MVHPAKNTFLFSKQEIKCFPNNFATFIILAEKSGKIIY